MSENTLQQEIDKLKQDYQLLTQELAKIRDSDSRALRRGVLSEAGATTEKILKFIYKKEGLEKNAKPADKMMIDELLTEINRFQVIPIGVLTQFRTLQQWRNIGSHDKGDILNEVDENAIITVNTAVAAIVNWFFNAYLKTDFTELIPATDSIQERTEQNKQGRIGGVEEWKELYWWAIRSGQLKLIDQKALDAIQKKNQLSDDAILSVKGSYSRKLEEFNQILEEALDDKVLDEYELEAIEHSRLECCISMREAKELLGERNIPGLTMHDEGSLAWLSEMAKKTESQSAEPKNETALVQPIAIEQSVNKEESVFEINTILNRIQNTISFNDLFWAPNIPERKVRNAIKNYKIPADEKIIGLIDSTVFGSADYGLALTSNGIFMCNSWSANPKGTFYFTWENFKEGRVNKSAIKSDRSTDIFVCKNVFLQYYGSDENKAAVQQLFDEIEKKL
jgi:hypothetical protein